MPTNAQFDTPEKTPSHPTVEDAPGLLQVFLVPLPYAARLKAHTPWLFLNIHCAHFDKKVAGSGQVGSPEQRRFVDPTSEVCNHARARVLGRSISSLHVFVRVPVGAICISYNFYICYLRSGQTRDLYIASLWENIEMTPVSCKRVKTTQVFQYYGRLSQR